MFQRIKTRAGAGYNDLDEGDSSRSAANIASSQDGNQANLHKAFRLNSSDDVSSLDLGRGIEMSAAAAGVVPDDTFTVDQAVNSIGFGKFQVKLSLITGLSWMADSMEMMILSILSPALRCAWRLPSWKQAMITTCVFLGMMLSAVFWGHLSDKYGRKRALTLSAVFLSFYGLLSAFSPTYFWMLLLRLLVGFAIGCTPQSVTLYAEFLPVNQRGKCVVLLDSFWALGACFEVLLALLVMPTLGWRWLLALSALPVFTFACICPKLRDKFKNTPSCGILVLKQCQETQRWLPESARFLATAGRTDEALTVLKRIAEDNGKPMLAGRLIVDDSVNNGVDTSSLNGEVSTLPIGQSPLRRLLSHELKTTTLLLWFIWLTCAFCYYGMVLMSTELLANAAAAAEQETCLNGNGNEVAHDDTDSCAAGCRELTSEDYTDLLWTTLAEFPGILITIVVIEYLGRKKTMAIEFLIFSLSTFLLFVCIKQRAVLTVILFVARGIISGVFQAAYVYTPEVYPTYLRAIGVGVCSGMARLGAMITPFVAQVLVQTSVNLSIGLYGTVGLMAMIASLLLPIETKGRAMH